MNQSHFIDRLRFQCIALILSWLFCILLHWNNDGLWFQGDAPRHAVNGLFLRDLIHEGLSNPVEFARSYYARYPVVTASRYPPLFYMIEAIAFEVFGASATVAKGVVQLFGLITGFYLLISIRRWISPTAGIAASLLFLMPGMISWNNAVMLNVPALCLAVVSLYHFRVGLEDTDEKQSPKHIGLATILAVLSILFHPTIGYVVIIGLAWVVASRKFHLLKDRRVRIVGACILLGLLGIFVVVTMITPEQLAQVDWKAQRFLRPGALAFYPIALLKLIDVWGILFSILGLLWAYSQPRFRTDCLRILLGILVVALILIPVWAKDPRYILLACPTATWLCAYYVQAIAVYLRANYSEKWAQSAIFASLLCLALYAAYTASTKPMQEVNFMQQVVQYVEQVAPEEPVIYEGRFDGTYGYYLRVRDPNFQRQMLLSKHLLEPIQKLAPENRVAAATELLLGSNCRWLILEKNKKLKLNTLEKVLQEVVKQPEFTLAKSFYMSHSHIEEIDVYRIEANDKASPGHPRSLPVQVKGQTWQPINRPNINRSGLLSKKPQSQDAGTPIP
jgi:hypothetical protein